MAWEEQRRLRGAQHHDTVELAGLPAGAGAAPAAVDVPAAAAGRGARVEAWGQRFGWMAAVALSAIALVLAMLAFANVGTTLPAGFGQGRGFATPHGGHGGPYRYGDPGPSFGRRQ